MAKIQCDNKNCTHRTLEDFCDLKEIEYDDSGNCMSVKININDKDSKDKDSVYQVKTNRVGILIHAEGVDSVAYDQIKTIKNHPSFVGLIAIMPDVHAGAGCVIGFTGKFKDSVIPNIVGVDIGCFTGDTKIPLLDGTQSSLKDLVGKKKFWVYSVDKNHKPVPGKAIALKTRKNAKLIEIMVSGGEIIRCTPNHEFMLFDGSYREAKDLKVFDSLMPLYRTFFKSGYEYVKARGKGGYAKHQKSCTTHKQILIEKKIAKEKSSEELNHKVLSIKKLDYKEDVYCLNVEKYHNFALSAGVFVHNCGVTTYKLPRNINLDLPALYNFIEKNIPSGFNKHNKSMRFNSVQKLIIKDCEKLVKDKKLNANPSLQAGTLGGGNHFIEVEKSPTTGDTYLTIHSGSRKFGLEVAKHHQKKAKTLLKQMNISVPRDLEYLPMEMGGNDYIKDMHIAQDYADLNRQLMLISILNYLEVRYDGVQKITSVHNYISSRDNIVRKGAISAHTYKPVVIPLNMGKDGGIVIGEGLGNKNYNYSAPHGAGRLFGRKVIKRKLKSGEFTMKTFKESMKGIYSRSVVENTIDESPAAYKSMESIEKHLKETIKIIDIARPILSFKDVK